MSVILSTIKFVKTFTKSFLALFMMMVFISTFWLPFTPSVSASEWYTWGSFVSAIISILISMYSNKEILY